MEKTRVVRKPAIQDYVEQLITGELPAPNPALQFMIGELVVARRLFGQAKSRHQQHEQRIAEAKEASARATGQMELLAATFDRLRALVVEKLEDLDKAAAEKTKRASG